MTQKGARVGAIQSADKDTVNFYGYGVYVGDEIPPDGFCHDVGIPNPKIQLDDGGIVWGQECWWGPEEQVKKQIGDRKIITVSKEENHA